VKFSAVFYSPCIPSLGPLIRLGVHFIGQNRTDAIAMYVDNSPTHRFEMRDKVLVRVHDRRQLQTKSSRRYSEA
jgi:hypothetical protein